jgi:hypothetical protein
LLNSEILHEAQEDQIKLALEDFYFESRPDLPYSELMPASAMDEEEQLRRAMEESLETMTNENDEAALVGELSLDDQQDEPLAQDT